MRRFSLDENMSGEFLSEEAVYEQWYSLTNSWSWKLAFVQKLLKDLPLMSRGRYLGNQRFKLKRCSILAK